MNKTILLFFAASIISICGNSQTFMQEQKKHYAPYHFTKEEDWDKLREVTPAQNQNNSKTTSTCTLGKRVFGWEPYWNGTTYTNYKWNLLSDLCYFDYTVTPATGANSNGSYNWSGSAAVTTAKANGVKVHICASLFSGFSTFWGSSTAQQTFITNMISELNSRGGNGVNLDFEGMGSSDAAPFVSFVQNLSTQLKAANSSYEVSIALYAVDWSGSFTIASLTPYVDLFIIMGYDYYYGGSGTAGPVGPLYNFQTSYNYTCISSIDYYLHAGVPNAKLLLGLPYYGYQWGTASNAIPATTTGSGTAELFNHVKANASGDYAAANYHWESNSFNPAYVFQSSGAWYQCWIDDGRSLAYKLDVVNERNIGGMGIWALGYDDGYSDYWNAIQNKISSCAVVPCSDTIYDMGGPSRNYYSNESYNFTIAPAGATHVKLNFMQFSTEVNYDSLWLYDGSSTAAPLIGKYTGTTSPGTVTSTGGSLCVRFKSDNSTVSTGYMAIWQCTVVPPDTTRPTTSITPPSGWITQTYTASYNDADNTGGSGLEKRFYNVSEYNGTAWTSNYTNGFFNDSFNLAAINAEWTQKVGTWAINAQHLEQSDQTLSNTNIYAPLTQTLSNRYVYNWQAMISGTGTNRRAGLHFFCDEPDSVNRGSNYFVWYRADQSVVEFYKTTNNVFTLVHSIPQTINVNVWYNNLVTYDRVTGEIAVWINNKYIGSYTDPTPISTGGYVSFRSGNCNYAVDNFKVYRSRAATTIIKVGSANTNDIQFQNNSPTNYAASISSIVKDSAYNLSSLATQTLNVDWTVPAVPSYVNDGTATDIDTVYTSTQLSANWAASADVNSGIAAYAYAIGTNAGAQNTVAWTNNGNNTAVTKIGLSLTIGQHYYFSIKAVDGAGLVCDSMNSNDVIVLASSMGINQLSGANVQVNIYPNPTKGIINVELKMQNGIQNTSLQITDMLGNTVKQFIIYNLESTIDIVDLSEGIYFVNILSDGLKISTQRIVVLK